MDVANGGALKRTVIHEIAHTIASGDRHGPVFARTMVELTKHAFGVQLAAQLLRAYRDKRARVGSPTKLRPAERVPATRPRQLTYRATYKKDGKLNEAVITEMSMRRAVLVLIDRIGYDTSDITEIRVWRSRNTKNVTGR